MCCLLSSYFLTQRFFLKIKCVKPTALRHNNYNWSQTFHLRVMNFHNVQRARFVKVLIQPELFSRLNHVAWIPFPSLCLQNVVIDCFFLLV